MALKFSANAPDDTPLVSNRRYHPCLFLLSLLVSAVHLTSAAGSLSNGRSAHLLKLAGNLIGPLFAVSSVDSPIGAFGPRLIGHSAIGWASEIRVRRFSTTVIA